MTRRLALHHQTGNTGTQKNVFGVSVANFQLFRAMLMHAGLDRIDFLTQAGVTPAHVAAQLLGDTPCATEVATAGLLNQAVAVEAGAVLRGGPRMDDMAWLRRSTVGDRAYSLMGVIHTIAPPSMRQDIAMAAVAPLHPWDALICTSPSVQAALTQMFDEWADYLDERFDGRKRDRPMLPLIPLGVDGAGFAALADRPDARAGLRAELGLGEDDVLVLWVGRLSFFEKAFPQPMMRAVAEAAAATGRRVHFAMAGWFPAGERDERMYRQAARVHAPDIGFSVIDGNDKDRLGRAWAAADVFLSLVDNIQETFGITPLEAMAAGLPVVVSDWDGYRYTVRHGQEGFLIPTLGGPEGGLPHELVAGHALGLKTYQQYVGVIAQHTAVHVGLAAQALEALIRSPDLRRRMGAAGRARVREAFDWSVVAPQYAALADTLAEVRAASFDPAPRSNRHPTKGDPFRDFAGFATRTLTLDTVLSLRAPARAADDLRRSGGVDLDMFAGNWRGSIDECLELAARLERDGPTRVRDLLVAFPMPRRRAMQLSLLWMSKQGLLDWLGVSPGATPGAPGAAVPARAGA